MIQGQLGGQIDTLTQGAIQQALMGMGGLRHMPAPSCDAPPDLWREYRDKLETNLHLIVDAQLLAGERLPAGLTERFSRLDRRMIEACGFLWRYRRLSTIARQAVEMMAAPPEEKTS